MAATVLFSSERVERLLEAGMVLLVGFAFRPEHLGWGHVAFAGALFLVLRPIAVLLGLVGARVPWREQSLLAWFGIRGIGSIYYLMYAVGHGIDDRLAHELVGITLTVVALSILVHGISVTPLMRLHAPHEKRR